MKLTDLSDAQLLDSLKTVCAQSRVLLARLLAHLGEVEERRLHLEAAFPSMLDFCMGRLGMSEGEACRRITAARAARRFPDLLMRIERGDVTLSTIVLVHKHLDEVNYQETMTAVAGKTKLQVLEILARRGCAGSDHSADERAAHGGQSAGCAGSVDGDTDGADDAAR
jgi:hypothetical protein